ncbi:riboflavin synthase [bacterium]|nr:MAG: riboflavin synthase [bacterium]
MFTGIIEEIGKVTKIQRVEGGCRLDVEACLVLEGTKPGDSISVDGVCLTVEDLDDIRFVCFASTETLEVTTLRTLRSGQEINLERALAFGDRIGGHLVSGHVETIGTVLAMDRHGESFSLVVGFPGNFAAFVVQKGSVAVDGISLTISDCEENRFEVAVIPETFEKTTLRLKRQGDSVNLEPDLILKYVRSAIESITGSESGSGLTLEKLIKSGFLAD